MTLYFTSSGFSLIIKVYTWTVEPQDNLNNPLFAVNCKGMGQSKRAHREWMASLPYTWKKLLNAVYQFFSSTNNQTVKDLKMNCRTNIKRQFSKQPGTIMLNNSECTATCRTSFPCRCKPNVQISIVYRLALYLPGRLINQCLLEPQDYLSNPFFRSKLQVHEPKQKGQ